MKSIMLVTDEDIKRKGEGKVGFLYCSDEIVKAEPYFDIIIYKGKDEIAIWKNKYGNIKKMQPDDTIYNLLKMFVSTKKILRIGSREVTVEYTG